MFDEHGMVIYGILTEIYPGTFITSHIEPIDPDAMYLIRAPNLTSGQFDEHDTMKGEEILNGAPIYVERVDRNAIERLVHGPLDLQ